VTSLSPKVTVAFLRAASSVYHSKVMPSTLGYHWDGELLSNIFISKQPFCHFFVFLLAYAGKLVASLLLCNAA